MRLLSSILLIILCTACSDEERLLVSNNMLEADAVNIQSEVAGRLLFSNIRLGEEVQKGQLLALIDTSKISNDLAIADANIRSLHSQKELLRSRSRTQQERILFLDDQRKKWQKLASKDAGPEQRADDYAHQYRLAHLQGREIAAQIASLQPQLAASRSQMANLRNQRQKHFILAPANGRITSKLAETGEVLRPGQRLGQIANAQKLYAYFYWPLDMLSDFAVGDSIAMFVDGSKTRHSGVITWVSETAEFTPKIVQSPANRAQMSYRIRIDLSNDDGRLKIGQPIEAHIPWLER
jgi:HlyD family secretion protein